MTNTIENRYTPDWVFPSLKIQSHHLVFLSQQSDEVYFCYSATRNYSNPTEVFEFFGFRVVCSI